MAILLTSIVRSFRKCGDNLFVLISENRGDNQSGGYQQNWSKYKNLIMS